LLHESTARVYGAQVVGREVEADAKGEGVEVEFAGWEGDDEGAEDYAADAEVAHYAVVAVSFFHGEALFGRYWGLYGGVRHFEARGCVEEGYAIYVRGVSACVWVRLQLLRGGGTGDFKSSMMRRPRLARLNFPCATWSWVTSKCDIPHVPIETAWKKVFENNLGHGFYAEPTK
jgi:hypothetical protein